jgi:hypothetical protein
MIPGNREILALRKRRRKLALGLACSFWPLHSHGLRATSCVLLDDHLPDRSFRPAFSPVPARCGI